MDLFHGGSLKLNLLFHAMRHGGCHDENTLKGSES